MTVTTVSYQKTFALPGYSNEKIGVEFTISAEENPIDAFAEAKKIVEKSHLLFKDLPNYERAKEVVAKPDNYTGNEVKQCTEAIKVFEENYTEYISKFNVPITRQITNNNEDDTPY